MIFLIALAVPLAFAYRSKPHVASSVTVFLEDMTWAEVKAAIDAGTRTVIVPTGGTEQNGPHLTLGKHNAIVHYTAGKIAGALGHTLVAPVVAYVPEGGMDPPEGHMRYAGTLSIRESVFADVLEDAARSLKQHGFTTIAFLGDSGGNQAAQQKVAYSLSQEWAAKGIRVLSLDAYYSDNHQVEYLQGLGFGPDQIGTHAGLRDTSELLSVNPQAVRDNQLEDFNVGGEFRDGYNGAITKASAKLGDELLRLKMNAAIDQLRH
jgi:creatinine amidohydrolase/Fe(II)-dependent formamide hydrolase-like protein